MSQDLHIILATDICAKAQGFENLSRGILKTWQHRVPFILFPRTYFKETEAQTYITTFKGLSYSVWNVKCGTCTAWVMSTVLCLLCPPFYSFNHNLSGVTFFCSAVLPWTLPSSLSCSRGNIAVFISISNTWLFLQGNVYKLVSPTGCFSECCLPIGWKSGCFCDLS